MNTTLARYYVIQARSDERNALTKIEDARRAYAGDLPRVGYHYRMIAAQDAHVAGDMWVRALIAILSPPE